MPVLGGMLRALEMLLLSLALVLDITTAKNYLIETEDNEKAKKPEHDYEHGSDYGNPKPYGEGHHHEVASAPAPVSCFWSRYGRWSRGNASCGTSTQTRRRFCWCSDGSPGSASSCGGGRHSELRTVDKGPCREADPAPYQLKKRQ